MGGIALFLAPAVLIGSCFAFLLLLTGGNAAACSVSGAAVDVSQVPQGPIAGYGHDQLVVAAAIMNAAKELGLDSQAQQVGVMTAMGESSLRPLTYGDNAVNPDGSIADSIGPFQQQSSWGTTEERLDGFKSATLFFQRLKAVDGWETLDPTLAAHAVQKNADPYFYTKYWAAAKVVTAELSGVPLTEGGAATAGCANGPIGYPLTKPFNMSDDYGPRPFVVYAASTYHPAVDLTGRCRTPIYSIGDGTVVLSDRLNLSIKSPDGYTVSYLHSHRRDRRVAVGDAVTMGQEIALIGNEAPSTGCHLDLRINVIGNINPQVAELPVDPRAPGWVDPEKFYALFGQTLCDDTCSRNYSE